MPKYRGKYESPDSRLSNYLESVENHSTVHWGDEKCSWQLPWHRSRYSKDLLNRLPYQKNKLPSERKNQQPMKRYAFLSPAPEDHIVLDATKCQKVPVKLSIPVFENEGNPHRPSPERVGKLHDKKMSTVCQSNSGLDTFDWLTEFIGEQLDNLANFTPCVENHETKRRKTDDAEENATINFICTPLLVNVPTKQATSLSSVRFVTTDSLRNSLPRHEKLRASVYDFGEMKAFLDNANIELEKLFLPRDSGLIPIPSEILGNSLPSQTALSMAENRFC